ncbi:hypothetical protein NLX86_33775 [Streptomyces sp. A3M-1-3]|uniref:hypothetical protein n=1 Tax=Streptomyces sp. A3M-1-3 TaxID=2962044 RepID=UPI0020B7C726|nr:hypothetical protein [Streptomyces sp. A3M-1-3]MCP3822866.1 hypothetical protein [Streptomyces sp. A3M-1-3]
MAKNVIVSLVGIKGIATGDDPGFNLEIYGDLFARRVFVNEVGEFHPLETHHLWHRNDTDRIQVTEGSTHTINSSSPQFAIHPGEFLWIGGHLADHDEFSNNDNLGFIDKKIPHDFIQSGPAGVVFQESEQIVEARYNILVS